MAVRSSLASLSLLALLAGCAVAPSTPTADLDGDTTAAGSPSPAGPSPAPSSPSSSAPSSAPSSDGAPGRGSSVRPTPSRPSPSPSPRESPSPMTQKQADQSLLRAAAVGDLAAARHALAADADLETRNGEEQTPLVVATKARQTPVALLLLAAGADPNAKDRLSDSAFLYAGAEGYDEILAATIRHGADVTSTNRYDGTALIPASEHAHVDTVQLLINAGVPLDHVNRLGWPALVEAIVLGAGSDRHVEVVRRLIAAGADPGVRDQQGRTPRQLAASRGQDRIVAVIDDAERLRERGRDLVLAARDGDADRVDRLLAGGASVAHRDGSGATALVAAAYGNHLDVARRLLEAGADPNAKDETVQSAYLISTSEVGDDPRLLDLTVRHGADVASLDSWRGTGLIRAADRGFHRIVTRLLQTGIAIDHVNRIGYTALHEAVVLGDGRAAHQQTVAVLVRGGVDTSIEDSRGATALQSARALGYDRIVELLA